MAENVGLSLEGADKTKFTLEKAGCADDPHSQVRCKHMLGRFDATDTSGLKIAKFHFYKENMYPRTWARAAALPLGIPPGGWTRMFLPQACRDEAGTCIWLGCMDFLVSL
jgi:hypothetical protein